MPCLADSYRAPLNCHTNIPSHYDEFIIGRPSTDTDIAFGDNAVCGTGNRAIRRCRSDADIACDRQSRRCRCGSNADGVRSRRCIHIRAAVGPAAVGGNSRQPRNVPMPALPFMTASAPTGAVVPMPTFPTKLALPLTLNKFGMVALGK